MRVVNSLNFTPAEVEGEQSKHPRLFSRAETPLKEASLLMYKNGTDYRQLVFSNVIGGMRLLFDACMMWDLEVSESNQVGFPKFSFF